MRNAVMQARQQHVEQATGPGPVGRRPEPVARLGEEIMRQLDPRQMAEQHAMRMQRALGLAGGAGGVDHQRRIVRRSLFRREVGRRARNEFVKAERAVAGTIDRQNEFQLRHFAADGRDLFGARGVGDQRRRA